MLPLGFAVPASAEATGASITVTPAGALSITVPANGVNLGSVASNAGGAAINGSLGTVQVSDLRSLTSGGWVVTVISTAFTPTAGPTVPAAQIGYTAGAIAKVGTATYTANDPGNLTGVSPAVTATGINGDNTATWNPTINIAIQGGAAAGVYTATITHSVA
jgi:hypothetical protein